MTTEYLYNQHPEPVKKALSRAIKQVIGRRDLARDYLDDFFQDWIFGKGLEDAIVRFDDRGNIHYSRTVSYARVVESMVESI